MATNPFTGNTQSGPLTLTGPVFTGNVTRAVEEAARKTAEWGKQQLQASTPVDTGFMRANWHSNIVPRYKGLAVEFTNTASYSPFVTVKGSNRTKNWSEVVAKAQVVPQIVEHFEEELSDAVGRTLGGRVTGASRQLAARLAGLVRR